MRRGFMLAVGVAAALAGCGESDGAERPPVFETRNPEMAFAPLVTLSKREQTLPISTEYFLHNSGLEWAGGPCFIAEADIAAGPASRPLTGDAANIPPMSSTRLGKKRVYGYEPRMKDCTTPRGQTFLASQHTRPFDVEDRPPGLYVDEGFNLDILTDYQAGKKRLTPDGALKGIPAYWAREDIEIDGKPGLRLSYWLLFGRGMAPMNGKLVKHEGDWERIDVMTRRARSGFTPVSVRYHDRVADRLRTVAWSDIELAGPGRSHPVAHLAPSTHTPFPRTGDRTGRLAWRTWDKLRDVQREPWYGYGGGWGAIAETEVESGPAGPSPFELTTDRGVASDDF